MSGESPSDSAERPISHVREALRRLDRAGGGDSGVQLDVEFDAPIGPRCTYRVGGAAAAVVTVHDHADLEALRSAIGDHPIDTLVVGRGSNLLVTDAGFDGVVVVLGAGFEAVEIEGCRVVAGGAALLPVVARRTAAAGLTGFEWAVGVPGSIGGAVRMNAGGHGSDMVASLVRVSLFDLRAGGPLDIDASDLDLAYRSSNLTEHHVVTFAELLLEEGDAEHAAAEISAIVAWRRANQPGGQNAGSVFANPEGDSAGRLIDAAGLKGFRIGTASVSDKHANFIQADPDGRADDVYRLIRHIQRVIADNDGIELRTENRLIGFSSNLADGTSGDRP